MPITITFHVFTYTITITVKQKPPLGQVTVFDGFYSCFYLNIPS